MTTLSFPAAPRGVAVLLVLTLSAACASPPRGPLGPVTAVAPGGDPWEVVMGLEEDRVVTVGLAPGSAAYATHGEQLRAWVIAADRSMLELRTTINDGAGERDGTTLTVPRGEVRYLQVLASQDRPRKGAWLGAGIGVASGVAAGAIGGGAGEEGSFWPIAAALFGAGLGFVGWLVGRGADRRRTAGDFITVYEAAPF